MTSDFAFIRRVVSFGGGRTVARTEITTKALLRCAELPFLGVELSWMPGYRLISQSQAEDYRVENYSRVEEECFPTKEALLASL